MHREQKTLQDLFRERRMKDMKREYYLQRVKQFWTIVKRLTLVATLGYGVHWAKKNPETVKSFLKSHSAPIEERVNAFKEGVGMIKDAFKTETSEQAEAYHKRREKSIKKYRKLGIDPVVRYAEPGTKEYRAEMEFYRKNGVFKANE